MRKTKKPRKEGVGRPEKLIDWDLVDDLLMAGCLGTEIASNFDMHPDTFYRRVEEKKNIGFTEYCQQKRSKGKSFIRKKQFDKALEGDNTMLVWVGKQLCDQKENNEVSVAPETSKAFASIMDQLNRRRESN